MKIKGFYSRRSAAFLHDCLSIPVAWLGAYWLRFNLGEIPEDILLHALRAFPCVLLLQTGAFWLFGLYRGVWRFASLPDLTRIVKAVMTGTLLMVLALFLIARLEHLPRSVIPLYSLLLLFILGGSRFIYRWSKDKRSFFQVQQAQNVLIVGAGVAGESLVRDLLRDPESNYLPVAFVDDRTQNQGRELHGIRVVGSCNDIPAIVKQHAVDMILIALPSANAPKMRRIVALCESTQKPVRTLPGMNDLVSGLVSVKNLREISLEDLLGRDPVTLNWDAIREGLTDKVVLISGGGGSIGAELCRQVIKLAPRQLIIVDNSEYNLFCIQEALSKKVNVLCHLVDLCDITMVKKLVAHYQPAIIFHAAAYKHVPLLESQVRIAARNNILGTYYLTQAAVACGVDKFVLVSSDKAVNPTNVMGATKRVAELVCQYFNEHYATRFMTVRFGNVLGSRGSVVETFQRQLEEGGPLTVTHPDVTRYFMTIQEASQLILQALVIGEGGELFVLDMGEPIKIRYMAEQMIRLAGKHKQEEIQIAYVGLRPGEKLFEELFHHREQLAATSHTKILKAHPRVIEEKKFEKSLLALQQAIHACDEEAVFEAIQGLVPELRRETVNACEEIEEKEQHKEIDTLLF